MRYPEADLRTRRLTADPYTLRRIQEESYRQVAEVLAHTSFLGRVAALDVGCGAGFDTFALGGEFDRVIGIDLSRTNIRTARRIAQESRLERIAFQRQDALASVPNGPFDFVYCNAMSHGTRSRGDLIRKLVLATKSGGWLFISEECEGYAPLETERAILERDERVLRERLRQAMNGLLGVTSFRFFVSGTIEPLLANYGAAVMYSETFDWEGLPYLERTWARRIKEKRMAEPVHTDYQVVPDGLRRLRDLCEPLVGKRLRPHERRLVRESAKSDDRLAPLAMFLLMAELVDPGLSNEQPSLMTRFRSQVPATLRRAQPDWQALRELFAEFRARVAG